MIEIRGKMDLLDLPDCMLEQIMEKLSYDEISKLRTVSARCIVSRSLFVLFSASLVHCSVSHVW